MIEQREECEQFNGRMKDICNGDCDRSLLYINKFREKRGLTPFQQRPRSTSVTTRAATRRTNGKSSKCSNCGSKAGRAVKQAMTFLQAAKRFLGDGAKTTTPEEQGHRESICANCPLYRDKKCELCGCYLKVKKKMRLEECPAHKWLPELRQRRPLVESKRNLIMHILPVKGNGIWQWNVEQIARRQNLFNGKRIISVAVMPGRTGISQRGGRKFETDRLEDVSNEFSKYGMRIDEYREFPNSTRLREVASFVPMMESLQSTDPNDVTFNCHAKAVTHDLNSITCRWAELQYHVCLDDWRTIENALESYSMAGAFRRFGQFTTAGNNRWHYSGTFYWFRHDDVFSRDWRDIDQKFFGTESWVGRMFTAEECSCIFGDDIGDLYKEATWNRVQKELTEWDRARGL